MTKPKKQIRKEKLNSSCLYVTSHKLVISLLMSTAIGSAYLAQRRGSPRSRGKKKGAEISTLLQTCFLYLKHMQKDQKLSITAVRRSLQLHAFSISQTSCVNLDKECKLLLQSLNESF